MLDPTSGRKRARLRSARPRRMSSAFGRRLERVGVASRVVQACGQRGQGRGQFRPYPPGCSASMARTDGRASMQEPAPPAPYRRRAAAST